MNKLLKSVRSSSSKERKKDDVIKKSITSNLSMTIKEIQYANVEETKSNKVVDGTEAGNQLCTIIEAIFLHGLRHSFAHKFKKALSDIDEKPEPPTFWSALLVISHRQIIDQITNLSQISSEVGQCRAWVRLVLNDCLLSSYLMTIRQDPSALKSYYNINAYVRDNDLLEVAQKLIEGLESFKMCTLPSNSSLLNTWQLQSLVLAGLWSPTLKNCPITPCDDVAQIIDEDTKQQQIIEEALETSSLCSDISFGSQISRFEPIFSEEDVFKMILAKDMDDAASKLSSQSSHPNSDAEPNKQNGNDSINHSIGNSLSRPGWSFDETKEEPAASDIKGNNDMEDSGHKELKKSMESSFTALVEGYNSVSGSPDIRGLWLKMEVEATEEANSNSSPTEPTSTRSLSNGPLTRSESVCLASQVFRIAVERGLDGLNFQCAGCKASFIGQEYQVCYYTGDYFCLKCMHSEKVAIPARIIHNWDFSSYSISRKSFTYINEIKDHPVIDFKSINPFIYAASEDMAHLQMLRRQLSFLRAYLYTCREPIIEQLQKLMWPREYMYEHIHQYSISDLDDVRNNVLSDQLEKVVKFGRSHVFSCWLCSQKGFVCEVCNNPNTLFPFDVDKVFRCDKCSAVYHKQCLDSTKPCRKCERRKLREELPILGVIAAD